MSESRPAISTLDDEVDLSVYFNIIWRFKVVILIVGILCGALANAYARYLVDPRYAAVAVVALEANELPAISGIERLATPNLGESTSLNTEVHVFRSRRIIGKLVDQLDLMADPEFNGGLSEAVTGESPAAIAARNRVIDVLLDAIDVSNIRQTLVFEIRVVTKNSAKSALIANTLAAIYINEQVEEKFEANRKAATFLSERAAELRQTLEGMEVTRNAFFERDRSISAEALAAVSAQLREIRTRTLELEAQETEQRGILERLNAAADDPVAFVALSNDTRLRQLLERLNPDDDFVRDSINAILARRAAELDRLQQQISALVISEQRLNEQVTQQSAGLIDLQQLEREIEATRLLYESFLARLKETNVQRGLEAPNSRLLSEAVPRAAISPRTRLITAFAVLLGLFLASTWMVFRELRLSRFRSIDELAQATSALVLGAVPRTPGRAGMSAIRYMVAKPNSAVSEAIRNLRTSVLMQHSDSPPKVILVTSSVPGEGKTTLSLALAANLRGLGGRVLLIEADIRRRAISEHISTAVEIDFVDAVRNPASLVESNLLNEELGVDILVGRQTDDNAADVFSSPEFARLMKVAQETYDHVVIDTPPVLAVSDARIIHKFSDASVYVVRWDSTSRSQVRQGLQMFSDYNLRITGLVLNQVDGAEMKRYGYDKEYGQIESDSGYFEN